MYVKKWALMLLGLGLFVLAICWYATPLGDMATRELGPYVVGETETRGGLQDGNGRA